MTLDIKATVSRAVTQLIKKKKTNKRKIKAIYRHTGSSVVLWIKRQDEEKFLKL